APITMRSAPASAACERSMSSTRTSSVLTVDASTRTPWRARWSEMSAPAIGPCPPWPPRGVTERTRTEAARSRSGRASFTPRVAHRARRLPARVPRHDDALADRLEAPDVRDDEHGASRAHDDLFGQVGRRSKPVGVDLSQHGEVGVARVEADQAAAVPLDRAP